MSLQQNDLIEKIRPSVELMGLSVWALELSGRGSKQTLRIYIDRDDSPVTISDCEKVSRQISMVLDVEGSIDSSYILEVSSPGIDRILVTPQHYKQFVGSNVEVRMRTPLDGRRNFSGLLYGVYDDCAVIRYEEHEYILPLEHIERGRISVE